MLKLLDDRHGNVNLYTAVVLAVTGTIGGYFWAVAANRLFGPYLRLAFGTFVLSLGYYLVFGAFNRLGWFRVAVPSRAREWPRRADSGCWSIAGLLQRAVECARCANWDASGRQPSGPRRRYAVRRWAGVVLAVMLAMELLPAPRRLYSAAVPEVYRLVATTGDESGRLLELPTGIRDGTSALGAFNASSEYFQTSHRRPLIGYLSRVSRWRKKENTRAPMLRALFALSEGRDLSDGQRDEARRSRTAFLQRSCVKKGAMH